LSTKRARRRGSLAWNGLFNTYFWLDPNKRVTGTIMTQLKPFAGDQVLKLFANWPAMPSCARRLTRALSLCCEPWLPSRRVECRRSSLIRSRHGTCSN
jgi:hypothetical protein